MVLLQSSHLDFKPRRQRREEEKVKAAAGRSIEAIVEVAPPPVRVELAPCAAPPCHQERLRDAGEALVAMHMSRNHRQRFTDLHKGRHKGALHCEIVRDQDTVGIRRMVQQDEDAPDVRPLLKALQLLLVPADLRTPLCRWQPPRVRIEKNEPQWPVDSRKPMASLQVWEACKEVP